MQTRSTDYEDFQQPEAHPGNSCRNAYSDGVPWRPGASAVGANDFSSDPAAAIMQLYSGLNARIVLTCNGPFCGKSKRTSEQLIIAGYPSANITRYQLGMPVWRALGNTVQTDLAGFLYVFRGDHTAVFVDARTPQEFASRTMHCAVNIQAGEATTANDDGRLPNWDKGTRVVVFANGAADAKKVASEIARKAYWNSSYFGGSLIDLRRAHVFGDEAEGRCPGPN